MLEFFAGKSVFVTGHTGFKGAWLCQVLKRAGAEVTGFALAPEFGSLFEEAAVSDGIASFIGDIRDSKLLSAAFDAAKPEIVMHLAAQPLVLESYDRPAYTFETNVMGTVNLLECVRRGNTIRSVVIATTDKVYRNNEWVYGYRETDSFGGNDPYSASKACVELASDAYRASFLHSAGIPLSTARSGNVIGGGDIAVNRIIPDCVRAAVRNKRVIIRNPSSVRPYQHVLDALFAYLLIARMQYEKPELAGSFNIGPHENDCVTTGELADIFCDRWGDGQSWESSPMNNASRESSFLRLDSSKMRHDFGWHPVWNVKKAVAMTVEWERARHSGGVVRAITDNQIGEFLEDAGE